MKLKYGDLIIFVCVALLAAGALLTGAASRGGAGVAEVWQAGRLVRVVGLEALAEPVSFGLDGAYHNKLTAERGRIRFTQADCPDKVCVNTGWVSRAGQTAACVPNRVLVKIVGEASGPDTVVR